MGFHLANLCPDMRGTRYPTKRWVLAFGAYGNHVLLVWANHLEDALDECLDWISENAPGLLCDNEVVECYQAALKDGKNDYTAWEDATVDTICGGNSGHYINSWECMILAENPDRSTLKEIIDRFTK